jgi:DNA-binding transcriptional regulator YiaG
LQRSGKDGRVGVYLEYYFKHLPVRGRDAGAITISRTDATDPASGRSAATEFSQRLKRWRQLNQIKQSALAHQLGVSQPAVSRWERGLDLPEPWRMTQLRQLMIETSNDELTLQALFISRQAGIRALIDYEDMSVVSVSMGYRALWPETSELLNVSMRDALVNEAQQIGDDDNMRRDVLAGAIGLISGVSTRHTSLQTDMPVPHRWHACFRRLGGRVYADMVFEPCAPDTPTGIIDTVYYDALK